MNTIPPGLYVHHRGAVVYVSGVSGDEDDRKVDIVNTGLWPEDRRPLPVGEFLERISGVTGLPCLDGIPRYQRVVGWRHGRPLVETDDTEPTGQRRTTREFIPSSGILSYVAERDL